MTKTNNERAALDRRIAMQTHLIDQAAHESGRASAFSADLATVRSLVAAGDWDAADAILERIADRIGEG